MRNDAQDQMVGIGTIRIKMFDGCPQMKKISVGAVESKGLKMMLENEILKVTKGSLVVMKWIRDRNLCYLKGSTVTGSLTASMVSNKDATQYGI